MLLFYFGVLLVLCASVSLLNGAVFFPSNSAYGIFAAIAVPLDLGPHRNVFVSYNFEANYNLPQNFQLPARDNKNGTTMKKSCATKKDPNTNYWSPLQCLPDGDKKDMDERISPMNLRTKAYVPFAKIQ